MRITFESRALEKQFETGRVIGMFKGKEDGPKLLALGGIHGNEPSGVIALHQVCEEIISKNIALKGSFLALTGNLAALKMGERYVDEDMNRVSTKEKIARIMSGGAQTAEEKEMADVMDEIRKFTEAGKAFYFVDCHTTSSASPPYISAGKAPQVLPFACRFPVYIVEESGGAIQGTLDDYLNEQGHTGFTFEAGQHDALSSIENQEAMIWLALANTGILEYAQLDCYPRCEQLLRQTTAVQGAKRFRMIYRYGIKRGENFKMKPGFVNFQKIEKGEVLAHNQHGPIHSEWDAHIFMPLYQAKGDDGFFVVEEKEEGC